MSPPETRAPKDADSARGSPVEGLEEGHRALLARTLREADRRRLAVFVVGGPVRDWLLGQPVRDLDLVVEAPAEDVAALAKRVAGATQPALLHPRFGTARVERDGATIDLAATRKEHYTRPGSLPSVASASVEEDLRRRDFSVNAMAFPLSEAARRRVDKPARGRATDRLLDLNHGREDLSRGVLRILHPRSFHDDPTRSLRAGRLVARLGFRLARGSRNALESALQEDVFQAVSGDRVRREIQLLFRDPALGVDPVRALLALERWGVLDALYPGVSVPRSVRAPLRRLGRAIAVPPWDLGDTRVWLAALALWCEGLGAATRRGFLARLSLRGTRVEWVETFARKGRAELARCERARGRGALDRELQPHSKEAILALTAKATAPLRRRIVRWMVEDRVLRVPVNGRDLAGLGLEGAAIGTALQALRSAWLDGKFRTRDEAMAFAREWAHQSARRGKGPRANTRRRGTRLPSGK